jgi:hypothetical protein
MDVVPVDYVANATVGLVNAFADYRAVQEIVHISCGKTSAELLSSVFRHSSAAVAPLGHISFTGRGTPWSKRVHGAVANLRIISALEHYLPFMRANVVYSNDRLRGILGGDLSQCDPVSIYLPELLANVSYKEALHESFKP